MSMSMGKSQRDQNSATRFWFEGTSPSGSWLQGLAPSLVPTFIVSLCFHNKHSTHCRTVDSTRRNTNNGNYSFGMFIDLGI